MSWLILVLTIVSPFAMAQETLAVTDLRYEVSAEAPSCVLLHQRELEREKVIRELAHLNELEKAAHVGALLFSNDLLVNKYFLDRASWSDANVRVHIILSVPETMAAHIASQTLDYTFIKTVAPGFIWHSFATQLPEGATIAYNAEARTLDLDYSIYQNEFCRPGMSAPVVTWIPTEPPAESNSFATLLALISRGFVRH